MANYGNGPDETYIVARNVSRIGKDRFQVADHQETYYRVEKQDMSQTCPMVMPIPGNDDHKPVGDVGEDDHTPNEGKHEPTLEDGTTAQIATLIIIV